MIVILVLLSSVLAAARGDCEACVNGTCHSRKTLIRGFHISDRMAVDHFHNVLYVQLNSNQNTALFLDDMQMRLVQTLNASSLTVDQDTHKLYTSDQTRTVYMHDLDRNITETASYQLYMEADSLFHKTSLYYTRRCCSGMYFFRNVESRYYPILNNSKITEFVVDKKDSLFFIADAKLFKFNTTLWEEPPTMVIEKKYSLSTDKYGELYLGDALSNIIYKFDYATNKLSEYAAYSTGTIDKFLFDSSNNIIFHDTVDGNVYKWQSEHTECNIKSNCTYFIETNPGQASQTL